MCVWFPFPRRTGAISIPAKTEGQTPTLVDASDCVASLKPEPPKKVHRPIYVPSEEHSCSDKALMVSCVLK
jgi:hypothetical protein